MSIHWSKEKKQFFISYKVTLPDGKRKTVSIYNPSWTKERGRRYLERIEKAVVNDDRRKRALLPLPKGKDARIGELVDSCVEQWRIDYKRQTAYHKEHIAAKYVLGYFGPVERVKDALSPESLSSFRRHVFGIEGISPSWKNKILLTFRGIIDLAAEREIIPYEAAIRAKKALKPMSERNQSSNKLAFWTDEEWSRFILSFRADDPYRMLFEVTYVCGLRLGELLALKWEDFDPAAKTLSINKASDNFGNLSSTKNDSSNATVSLPSYLSEALSQYRLDFAGNPDDWVFFAGHHASRTTVRRVMKEHIDASGVPFIKFHGLRHSCASHLIHAGLSPLIVSRHLRHSSVKETLDTYAHIFPNDTVGIMDGLFPSQSSTENECPSECPSICPSFKQKPSN